MHLPILDHLPAEYSLEYLEWLKPFPCAITGKNFRVERAHLIHVGMGANRLRPDPRHFTALPMHSEKHWEHDTWKGKRLTKEGRILTFEEYYQVNLWQYVFRFNLAFWQMKMEEVTT